MLLRKGIILHIHLIRKKCKMKEENAKEKGRLLKKKETE